ncbi:hypothetical protein ACFYWH_40125 [Streptomyces sp. NPDC003737]
MTDGRGHAVALALGIDGLLYAAEQEQLAYDTWGLWQAVPG